MKKGMFLLLAAHLALGADAQTKPVEKKVNKYADSLLARWCIDANVMGGMVSQGLTLNNTTGNYLNSVSSNSGSAKFSNGSSFGGEWQLGYFFGHKRHFGVGAGIMYLAQQGDVTLSGYHVEFQSVDQNSHLFRQVLSTNGDIKEKESISNFNIPILLKYKNRFSKHWGFTADAGLMINLQEKNSYTTNASFNYEAIYKSESGAFVYDNAAIPATSDVFWTKTNWVKDNPTGDVNAYFAQQRTNGYNVGLGVTPSSTTGSVSYLTGSVGFLVSPAIICLIMWLSIWAFIICSSHSRTMFLQLTSSRTR